MKRGKLIVISAPSGCGKTTIARALLQRNPEFSFSVSATTRPKRSYEVDGKDYYFLTGKKFEQNCKNGELVEWEEIYGYYYGTLTRVVKEALEQGKVLIFDVDVNGGLSIKEKFPDDSLLIFIEPPSIEVLKNRLRKRNTEADSDLQKRLERVPMELKKGKLYNYTVVNDELEKAIDEVEEIIRNEISSKINT